MHGRVTAWRIEKRPVTEMVQVQSLQQLNLFHEVSKTQIYIPILCDWIGLCSYVQKVFAYRGLIVKPKQTNCVNTLTKSLVQCLNAARV